MGRIIFDTATTINGWIADEQNSLAEWVLAESDILNHPEKWHDFHGDRSTFVLTNRDLPVPDGADVTFLRGNVADALPQQRAAAGEKDIWVVGGGDLAGQFLDAGALDEIAVSIAPVLLTGGAPLLPRRVESDRLRLVSAKAVGQFARVVYAVTPPSA